MKRYKHSISASLLLICLVTLFSCEGNGIVEYPPAYYSRCVERDTDGNYLGPQLDGQWDYEAGFELGCVTASSTSISLGPSLVNGWNGFFRINTSCQAGDSILLVLDEQYAEQIQIRLLGDSHNGSSLWLPAYASSIIFIETENGNFENGDQLAVSFNLMGMGQMDLNLSFFNEPVAAVMHSQLFPPFPNPVPNGDSLTIPAWLYEDETLQAEVWDPHGGCIALYDWRDSADVSQHRIPIVSDVSPLEVVIRAGTLQISGRICIE